jgi:dATP pyrophosphohydrolase
MRAKYQVLVIPYVKTSDGILYCIFKRSDAADCWQFIAGGGETDDSDVLFSAKRESNEEAGISFDSKFVALETTCSISAECFASAREDWGEDCLVIPEYSFAVEVKFDDIQISREHSIFEWVDYDTAKHRLRYDSNKVALWELDNKIRLGIIK